jgi:hypothetical protein
MKLKNPKTIVLPQLTLHNTSSLRVRTYAHKEKECFIASTASNDAVDFPPAHEYLTIGGVQ